MALTLKAVRAKVAEIRAAAGDYERAHGLEDDLHQAVLKAVVAAHDARRFGDADPDVITTLRDLAEMARTALRTRRIDFPRHAS